MSHHLHTLLDGLLTPRSVSGRILLTGWFSFLAGEVTAGDALAQHAVSEELDRLGIGHDTAWSPGFAPGRLSLDTASPEAYEQLLFVCGPVHGEQVAGLHRRYARCRRVALGVSVVDPAAPAVTGFDRRDRPAAAARSVTGCRRPGSGSAGRRRPHPWSGRVRGPAGP